MSDYSVTKPKGPYPTDLPEVKVGPNEETIVTYGEDAIVSLDIVERLNENIIADAFERRAIVDGALCERLIRERKEAAKTIKRLRAERDECERQLQDSFSKTGAILEERNVLRAALKPFSYYASQIPDDVSDTASASGTVGDLRAARAAIEGEKK